MTSRGLVTALLSDSLYNPQPLLRTIREYMTDAVIGAIAREYTVKGRLLFVATTNLDVPVGVLWNIGAIAASASPRKAELIARIMLASASIPGAFPPVMIDVEVGDQHFQEMHVDGGTVAQVVLYPPSFGGGDVGQILQAADPEMVRLLRQRQRRLFVIRNSRPGPDPSTVNRSTLKIVERAVSTLINTQGIGDLYQLYLLSQRDRVDFNVAYIPQSFTERLERPFDTTYMRKLYELGRQEMLDGNAWHKTPPGYDPTPFHSIVQGASMG
jgi:predicted acylesterase/phospholipase RssA